jgi:hypothetical protein
MAKVVMGAAQGAGHGAAGHAQRFGNVGFA